MKVGDLVKETPRTIRHQRGIIDCRVGIIIDNAAQKNCYVVQFFDGKVPSSNSYRRDHLRKVNEAR